MQEATGKCSGSAKQEEPLCQYSLRRCTNLRYGGQPLCARHLVAESRDPRLQLCQYQSGASQSNRCGEVVEKPRRYCQQHDPDWQSAPAAELNLPAQRSAESALQDLLSSVNSLQSKSPAQFSFADAFQVGQLVKAKVAEPSYHRVRDQLAECLSDTDSSLSDDVSDAEAEFPSTAEVYTRPEVVRAAKCKLRALRTAYEDELLRLQRELRQSYEQYAAGRPKQASAARRQKSAYERCQVLTRTDKWLRRRATERRYHAAYIEQMKPPSVRRCSHAEPGQSKCHERALPLAGHCAAHILHEPGQRLFVPCGHADCRQPVLRFEPSGKCRLHRDYADQQLPDDLLAEAEQQLQTESRPQVLLQSPRSAARQQQRQAAAAASSCESASVEQRPINTTADLSDIDFDMVTLPSGVASSDVDTIMRDRAFDLDLFSPAQFSAILDSHHQHGEQQQQQQEEEDEQEGQEVKEEQQLEQQQQEQQQQKQEPQQEQQEQKQEQEQERERQQEPQQEEQQQEQQQQQQQKQEPQKEEEQQQEEQQDQEREQEQKSVDACRGISDGDSSATADSEPRERLPQQLPEAQVTADEASEMEVEESADASAMETETIDASAAEAQEASAQEMSAQEASAQEMSAQEALREQDMSMQDSSEPAAQSATSQSQAASGQAAEEEDEAGQATERKHRHSDKEEDVVKALMMLTGKPDGR